MLSAYLFIAIQSPLIGPNTSLVPEVIKRAEVISSPNWSDPLNYPDRAADREEEGMVEFALVVDENGQAQECRITATSGSDSLDAGTCALARQMRFKPALTASNKPIASIYVNKVAWLLDDPRPIGATWLDADLQFADGRMTRCVTRGDGPYYQPWRFMACGYAMGLTLKPQFASGIPANLHLSLRVDFRKMSSNPDWPAGKVLARDATRFSVGREGDPSRCTPEDDGDIFSNDYRSQNPCGHFLNSLWLEAPKLRETAPEGRYELRLIAP